MNIPGDIFDTMRFQSSIFFRSGLAAPWGMALDESSLLRFHISLSGQFFVGENTQCEPQRVEEMDVVLLTGGQAHWIADEPGRALVPSPEVSASCSMGSPMFQSGDITQQVMCGLVHLDPDTSHPFLDALPPIVHLPHLKRSSQAWRLVELIDAEAECGLDDNIKIINRLAEALFLMLLREIMEQYSDLPGFIGALRDRRIHHALKIIHAEPEKHWTINDIASQVGMSRASLIRHFRDQVGLAPIEYQRRWRLMKARNLIFQTNNTLESIAERTGYSSAQTLARAFKSEFGYSANSARKT